MKWIQFLISSLIALNINAQSYSHPATGDEFVGPFNSWFQTNAGNDSITDATPYLQAWADTVGKNGSPHQTAYLKAGTYRITNSIFFNKRFAGRLIGAHPDSVKIIWNGPPDGTMFVVYSSAHCKINRITFDGRGSAGIIVDQTWDGTEGGFFDTGNEYADCVFKNAGTGIRGGFGYGGFAECSIYRNKFLYLNYCAISLGNFNALDIWIRYNLFDHCNVGVTNYLTYPGFYQGAGNFKVYNNVFRYSTTADIQIGNTGEFTIRENYSYQSYQFIGPPSGFSQNPAPIVIAGNVVIDNVLWQTIQLANQGPVTFMDNVLKSTPGVYVGVFSLYAATGATQLVINNTFTSTDPIYYGSNKSIHYNNQIVDRSTINIPEPTLPGTPINYNRPIYEVTGASEIQSKINLADAQNRGNRPVVHFPFAVYNITSKVTIPAGSDVQIVGDGSGDSRSTFIHYTGTIANDSTAFRIYAPSKVTFRDISITAEYRGTAMEIVNLDSSASVWANQLNLAANWTNLHARGAAMKLYNSNNATGYDIGFDLDSGAVIKADALSMSNCEVSVKLRGNSSIHLRDIWQEENNNRTNFLDATGSTGNFIVEGSHVFNHPNTTLQFDFHDFKGSATLLNAYMTRRTSITGNNTGMKFLAINTLTDSTYFINTGTGATKISSYNRRAKLDSQDLDNNASTFINDTDTPDTAFINHMLQPIRNLNGSGFLQHSLPANVSDIRFSNIDLVSSRDGLKIQGNGVALEDAGDYTPPVITGKPRKVYFIRRL